MGGTTNNYIFDTDTGKWIPNVGNSSGSSAVAVEAGTTIYNGKTTVTTGGTQVVLASTQTVKGVVVKALAANTGFIYVGDLDVSSVIGLELAAGEAVSLDIADLATVWIDSSVNGEGVTYIATN